MSSMNLSSPGRRLVLAVALLVGVLVGVAGAGFAGGDRLPSVFAGQDDPAGVCAVEEPEIGAEAFARSELYFGSAKPDGSAVTNAEWSAFLDTEITPRFPDGLTVLTGMGQWQESDDDIVQEQSRVVILFYPEQFAAGSGALIEEIRAAYETAFQQESVLRADDDAAPVCVSF